MQQYLGPSRGTVTFSTWDDLVRAASGGLLDETQWCELKAMPSPSNKPNNVELARDLASLSVYGGLLIFGVEDKTFKVLGCDTGGLDDRVAQVAMTRVSPPLSPIIHRLLPDPDDESKSVMIVQVPRSRLAPHMVDDNYWGRSSNGKRKLSDAEVRELLQARATTSQEFRERLLRIVDNDPLARLTEGHPTGNGHLYLLAEPCTPVIGGEIESMGLKNATIEAGALDANTFGVLGLPGLSYPAADPLGVAWKSHLDPVGASGERALGYLLVHADDLTVEFTYGGATAELEEPNRGGTQVVLLGRSILVVTRQFLRLVKGLSEQWGYAGQWRVGIHATQLLDSIWSQNTAWGNETPFTRDSFTVDRVEAPVTWSETAEQETVRLLEGFLRGAGRADWSFGELVGRR